jgi:hypothetical protein
VHVHVCNNVHGPVLVQWAGGVKRLLDTGRVSCAFLVYKSRHGCVWSNKPDCVRSSIVTSCMSASAVFAIVEKLQQKNDIKWFGYHNLLILIVGSSSLSWHSPSPPVSAPASTCSHHGRGLAYHPLCC